MGAASQPRVKQRKKNEKNQGTPRELSCVVGGVSSPTIFLSCGDTSNEDMSRGASCRIGLRELIDTGQRNSMFRRTYSVDTALSSRHDPSLPPKAIFVGTASTTIVSFPEGLISTFVDAGFDLEALRLLPRQHLAAMRDAPNLDVRGPAFLAYWASSPTQRSDDALSHLIDGA